MKIEIGESLGYSFLRHVKQCWLVQSNWKASRYWDKLQSDDDLEQKFTVLKEKFDPDGNVFKGTKNCGQLLQQGEIDVVGVDQDGSIHAMEVAFHGAGLNYGGGVANRVLKKLLRTTLILDAYHSTERERHIYFVSPKVNRATQKSLDSTLALLQQQFPTIHWYLLTNDDFTNELLVPSLHRTERVADDSELFARAAKLLSISGLMIEGNRSKAALDLTKRNRVSVTQPPIKQVTERGSFQEIVRSLMETLLEDYPTLLSQSERYNLMDSDYCKNVLGLSISNLALLRPLESGRLVSGRSRYWAKRYGGEFYVVSQWWQSFHSTNAERLLQFVVELKKRNPDNVNLSELQRHERALQAFCG